MANYRIIKTTIFSDPDFQKYSPLGKLIFLFLCINPNTRESGIYPCSIKTISDNTGIPIEEIPNILKSLKNISYDFEDQVVFVKNFTKYNRDRGGRPELCYKSIANDMKTIVTTLWEDFAIEYPDVMQHIKNTAATEHIIKKRKKGKKTYIHQMWGIFLEVRQKYRKDTYRWMPQDGQIAHRLYSICILDDEKDPLGYFRKKVEGLMAKFSIEQFGGIERFWNQVNVLKDTTSHPLLDTDYKTGFQEI